MATVTHVTEEEGKYEINKRLDVAIDRLPERLFTRITTKPTDLQSLIPDDVETDLPFN